MRADSRFFRSSSSSTSFFFLSSSREGFVLRCAHAWGGIMIVSSGPLRLSADCFRADGRLEKVLFSARLGRLIAWFGARFRLLDV